MSTVALLTGIWSVAGCAVIQSHKGQIGRTSELVLRNSVTVAPKPEFPSDTLKHNVSGIAVAEILVSPEGEVTKIRVVDAPDALVAKSVTAALLRWHFMLPKEAGGASWSGLISFYFVISNGRGLVLNPDEAGYVGRMSHSLQ